MGLTPKPITREDMYYDYMINGSGYLPKPITRKEMYLYYLCVNGFGTQGGGGTTNYNGLDNKPQINGVTLQGDLTSHDLGIQEFSGDYQDLQGAPDALPCPFPVTFKGMLPNVSYDGSQPVNITFPDMELTNESAGTPVGEIISHMGVTAPKHYLACDGAECNIVDYPYLAQHFIDDFGSVNYFGGDGVDTFAVPDLRGEFLRGSGENLHENQGGGGNVGDHQDASLHPGIMYNNPYITYNRAGYDANLNECNYDYVSDTPSQIVVVNGSTSNNQYRTNVNNYTSRPTNTSVLWCIKYEPTYFMKVTGHIYSYEERLVGTWVDGKPLYEKTVDFGNLPNATTKEVPHGIEDVDLIWLHDGLAKTENGTCVPLNFPCPGNMVQTYCDKNKISITTQYNRSEYSSIVILRYTKTTDPK